MLQHLISKQALLAILGQNDQTLHLKFNDVAVFHIQRSKLPVTNDYAD